VTSHKRGKKDRIATTTKRTYLWNRYFVVFKGEFVVVPTDKICGGSLSYKSTIDMNSIFMKLYVT
jgi:hypothetical protein